MLTLTPNATTVIRSLLDGSQLPETGGLRIAGASDGQQAFTVTTAPTPEAGDQVVEDSGARVFVDVTAAQALGETVLDADVDEQGNIQFLITAQAG
ncbi:MAG: Fe-S cluster assembly protein HesB [Acidimicrobiia bacterium]